MAEFEGGMVASVRFEGEYIFVFQSQFMSNSRSTFEIQYALNTVLHHFWRRFASFLAEDSARPRLVPEHELMGEVLNSVAIFA
jgi:hypothetical protein